MDISLSTPALIFPAISLLLLAYTNRFMTIMGRGRILNERHKENPNDVLVGQIKSLRARLYLIRNMQACGVASLFLCVLCLFVLFFGFNTIGKIVFSLSLILMLISLALSFKEILLSVKALDLELSHMEKKDS